MVFFRLNQVRFALKFLSEAKQLPSKSKMTEDMQIQMQKHWNLGYRKHQAHHLDAEKLEYISQLAESANIEGVPTVFVKIVEESRNTIRSDPIGFRKYKYIIIDDHTFRKEKYEE